MTELVITEVGDTWINSARPGANYEDTNGARAQSGSKYILLLPELPALAGATVLDAFLVGRGAAALSAQTLTVAPPNERWSPGTVKHPGPDVDAGAAVATAISATAVDVPITMTGLAAILQAVADGSDWYGLRIATSAGTEQRFRTVDSGLPAWELHIEISDIPDAPTNPRPDGGGEVETSTPITAWDFGNALIEQAQFQIQVDTPTGGADPDDVSPDFTSSWITGVDEEYDLADSGHTPSGAGPHYWRVRAVDESGDTSDAVWSDWAEYTVAAMPDLVLDSPVGAFGDPSPTVVAHLSSGTLAHWKGIITGPDRSDIRVRSGLQTGDIEWEVPFRNADGRRVITEPITFLGGLGVPADYDGPAGWLRLRAWPEADRAVAVGQPPYVELWEPLYFDDDLGVTAPTDLTVVQYATGDPRLVWTWWHNETPAAFLIQVDGRTVARLDPADLDVDGGFYTWVDHGEVSPLRPHELAVRAAEDGVRSEAATASEHAHVVEGVWLLPSEATPILLDGRTIGDFAHSDRVATFVPLKGPEVDVIYDYEGLKGGFVGSVDSQQDVWTALDQIEALRLSRVRTCRMVWGSQSITVRLRDLSATSADDIDPDNLLHNVRFGFVQVGD